MEPDISLFRRQFFTARAAVRCNGPLPGYQVEPSELAPTKPISLGLTNFQQAKPEKEANLPLSPSLEAWLTCQATTLEGKKPAWESLKPTLGQKSYPKLPEEIAGRLSKFSGGLVRDRCRPLGHAHRTMGVQDPLCDAAATETSGTRDHIPQGVLKVVVSEPVSARTAEQGSDRASSTHPGFYSRLFLVRKATGEWRPIIDLSSLNVFVHCPSFTMEKPRSIFRAPQQGQWLTSLDLKDAYFHIGSTQQTDTVLSQRHLLAVHSTVIRVVNQSENIYQNTQTCTSNCPPPSGKNCTCT